MQLRISEGCLQTMSSSSQNMVRCASLSAIQVHFHITFPAKIFPTLHRHHPPDPSSPLYLLCLLRVPLILILTDGRQVLCGKGHKLTYEDLMTKSRPFPPIYMAKMAFCHHIPFCPSLKSL